jgi:hypothetical protein
VLLDYENNNTKVSLDVNNPIKKFTLVEVQEDIPKAFAQSARHVEFNPYPDKILRDDPLVQWNLKDLQINDNRTMSYLTKGILDEFSGYIYFPLKELHMIETRLPTGLKLMDIKIEPLFIGKASIGKITVENTGDEAKRLEFTMNLPSGWKVEPEKIDIVVDAREKKELKFSIIVPEDSLRGDYIGTAIIVWGEDTYLREFVLPVLSTSSYIPFLVVAAGLLGGAAVYLIKRKKEADRQVVYNLRRVVVGLKKAAVEVPMPKEEFRTIEKLKSELIADAKEEVKEKIMNKLREHLLQEMEGSVMEKRREKA